MVDCTPDPNLLESMRSVGYSLNTAVADIIDNSIAAHAKTISIRYFDHGEDPYVAIIDDGDGMDYETASERAQPQCGMRSTLHLYRHDGAEHRLIVFITQGRESFAHTAWSRKQVYDRYWIHGHSENSLN